MSAQFDNLQIFYFVFVNTETHQCPDLLYPAFAGCAGAAEPLCAAGEAVPVFGLAGNGILVQPSFMRHIAFKSRQGNGFPAETVIYLARLAPEKVGPTPALAEIGVDLRRRSARLCARR